MTEKPHLSTKEHHQDEVDDDDIELHFISVKTCETNVEVRT